jgi:glycerol uptake facilitator-like aquaporin
MIYHQPSCFVENEHNKALLNRATVEFVGTLLLMFIATGSGLVTTHFDSGVHPIALLFSAVAISGALVALIFAFGPVSGGHFNPLITVLQWLGGQRSLKCMAAYVTGQFSGAILGTLLANITFNAVTLPSHSQIALRALLLSELIASMGLIVIVFGCMYGGKKDMGPLAVGAWLLAGIVSTPSASYANPAITIAAIFSDGPIQLSSTTAACYVPAELMGGLLAFGLIKLCYPLSIQATLTLLRKENRE